MNWYKINSQVGANGETDIFIMDEIGRWGISADQLINEVQTLQPKTINLHVNSPGGSVSDGLAIYTYLRAHSATVTVYISARAASIAGVIAMAGDSVVMTDESLLHMHQASVVGWIEANADELQDTAAALRKMDSIIAGVYRKRTGASDDKLSEWMSGETYFTAQEALAEGLIDRIEDKVRMVACAPTWNAADYPALKAKQNLTGGHPSGGQSQTLARHPDGPKTQNKGDTDMSEELKKQIASLTTDLATAKADNAQEKKTRQEAIDNAVDKATTATNDAHAKRVDSIVALADKYGKDGDLDALANTAIKDGQTADDFKDAVLDAVAKRPTTQRAEGGSGDEGGAQAKSKTVAEYNALSHAARRAFKADGGVVVDSK